MKNQEPLTFVNLALALSRDYSRLFVIDSENDSYVEYATDGDEKKLIPVSGGQDFFKDVRRDTLEQVWKDDQEYFLNAFQKENIMQALENGKSFSLTYRLSIEGKPRYFFLKTIRANNQNIIIGVQDIDEQKRKELEAEAEKRTYSEIAETLASLFEVIYYIDINNGSYTEYSSSASYAKLGFHQSGEDFFKRAKTDMKRVIHPDDCERIMHELQRNVLLDNLKKLGSVSLTYRQVLDDRTQYMNLLAFYQQNHTGHIVVGVRNVDEHVRHEQSILAQSQTFSDISTALAQRYEIIYHVNIITNEYFEYTTNDKYARLKSSTKGKNFFAQTQIDIQHDIYPDDLPMVSISLQKENLLKSLSAFGKTILNYRLIVDGRPQYVSLYAVRPKEDSEHIIIALANVDAAKRMELAYQNALDLANRDALTGVKNKRAYVQFEIQLDEQIKKKENPSFAVVICDVNGLKQVNDTQGHKAGDDFIRKACSVICNTFKHSPVFRIGGDEFAVILKGQDYLQRKELINQLHIILNQQKNNELLLLASGISEFEPEKDIRVQDVFERADALMYLDKKQCKASLLPR